MAILLRCVDRWGRLVVLDDEVWFDHVIRRRAYFRVEDVIANPMFVNHDVDYDDRECFYAPSPLPHPYADLLIKVIVAYHADATGGPDWGRVPTVYPLA